MLEHINNKINSIVWGPVTLTLILLVGIMFSIRTKFFQLTHLSLWIKKTFGTFIYIDKKIDTNKKELKGISPFQAMTAALAGTMGTGNIVGVATAITLGGPGAVFWMWIAAFLGMMTIFAENVLGVKYRIKNKNNQWVGGPMYYISQGLDSKLLSVVFAIACTLASFGIGNMAQSNSITDALENTFHVPILFSSLFLMLIIATIIFGGAKRIVRVTEKLVPFMTTFYVLGGLIVIFANIKNIPDVLSKIILEAFNNQAIAGGTGGYVIANAMKQGIAKGVFSNEAGLGSSPIVHAAAETEEPVEQGMWGIFQVFVDTMLGCSITALCILSSGVINSGEEGVALSTLAFSSVFGNFGSVFVTISIILFAFSTLISWSYYGEKSIEYLTNGKSLATHTYKIIFTLVTLLGGIINLRFVWSISDTFNGIMALPNLISLIFLSPIVIKETKLYLSKYYKNKR